MEYGIEAFGLLVYQRQIRKVVSLLGNFLADDDYWQVRRDDALLKGVWGFNEEIWSTQNRYRENRDVLSC